MNTRPSGLCHAKIKVKWLVSLKIVKVRRYKDSSNHTYLLLDVDKLKRPQVIRTLVEKKAVKNYLPLAITVTVRFQLERFSFSLSHTIEFWYQ
ncbi:hypothetical protein GLOIN_2v1487159 [Rhizophagus irregularis DAOM 181602=DAOM 197198]|nr:hypothetical protein GLOIN_2v1487159 [Rhizophagus irregularis DAOM 181602=DAOM 197198]